MGREDSSHAALHRKPSWKSQSRIERRLTRKRDGIQTVARSRVCRCGIRWPLPQVGRERPSLCDRSQRPGGLLTAALGVTILTVALGVAG
jgi:hypothetical protein